MNASLSALHDASMTIMSPPRLSQSSPTLSIAAIALALPLSLGISLPSQAQPTARAVSGTTPAAETAPTSAAIEAPRAARVVAVTRAKNESWTERIEAQGNIMPWQETRIGTEIGGLPLVAVQANVGDVVKKGQILARLSPASVEAELDAANAQLMEAQAASAQAVATLERAKRLAPSGGVSQQEMTLYETQKQTAAARLNAARAQVKAQQLKLNATTVVAPDDGIISTRTAAEGAIVQAGSELFRLIRQGRLEWRAEVKGEILIKLTAGQEATIRSPLDHDVKGHVRQVSPTIDLTTRNGLVYVDLPLDTNLKAGLYVSGTLSLNPRKVLTVPSTAIQREGANARVFKIGADGKLEAVDVQLGRTQDGREEIVSGLDARTRIVADNVSGLKTGEEVSVQEPPQPAKTHAPATPTKPES